MTASDLKIKLKEMLGSMGTSVSDIMLQSAIDTALDDLARLKPKIGYEIVTLRRGIDTYPVPEGTYNVLEVIFPEWMGNESDAGLFQEFASIGDGELSTFHSHSLAVILAQKWEQLSSRYSYDWEYDIDSESVLVMPTPRDNSKMVLKIAYERTLEELPKSLVKPLEQLALSECMRTMATTIDGGITSVPIGIGSVTFDSSRTLKQADMLRAEAIKKLGPVGSGMGSVIIG